MKIIFMGSAPFAVPALSLLSKKFTVVGVVAQPDKPAGRGQKLTAPPTMAAAKKLGIPTFQPKTLRDDDTLNTMRHLNPDLIVVTAYGKRVPRSLFTMPRLGTINIHPSLLPKYRGPAPIHWAIINGETKTGVTIMQIDEGMDAGDILLQKEVPIHETDTAMTLHERLADLGAELLLDAIYGLEKKTVEPRSQNHAAATLAPLLKKEDGKIRWNQPARAILNRIRGLQPWPGTHTRLNGAALAVQAARLLPEKSGAKPGTVVATTDGLHIATADFNLCLTEVQLAGKKRMTATEFMRGNPIEVGTKLD